MRKLLSSAFPFRASNPLLFDALVYSAVTATAFLSFNHPDILHTIACSTVILNGHLADFYSVADAAFGHVNYLPATYLLFAVWGLPLKIFGFLGAVSFADPAWLFFWYKVMTSVFFAASALVLYKICLEFTKDKARALFAGVVWISAPVAFFSQFIFGQYDVIYLFFMLLGLLYYVRGDLLRYSFWFSISVSFKYFPVFIFFPLLFLREKNLKKLFLYCVVFAAPNILQILAFIHSDAFIQGVLGFGAAKRALNKGLLLWPLISVYTYLVNLKTRAQYDLFFYCKIALLSFGLIFSHTSWHPQWLLVLTPFMAVLAALSGNIRTMFFVDIVFSFAFFSHSFRAFPAAVDTNLFGMGLWGIFNPAFTALQRVYPISDVGIYVLGSQKNLFHIIIVSVFVIALASRLPKEPVEGERSAYSLARLRFYGVLAVFLASAFYAYHKSLTSSVL